MKMIIASDLHGAVGIDNKLPWKLPVDLEHFKEITEGGTIIMGRSTFDSLPKILPNRNHIVLSRTYREHPSPYVEYVTNYEEILADFRGDENAYVIGGPIVANLFQPYCTDLYLTKVIATVEADAYWNQDEEWELHDHEYAHDQQYDMLFCHFKRKEMY